MIKAYEFCKRVFDGTHDTPKPTESGYKLLTSKHIENGTLNKENAYYISKEDYETINKRSQVKKWDILFGMIGTIGNTYLIENEPVDFAIKNIGVFSCEDEYKAKWLYFYLQSPYAKKIIQNYLNGAVQKFISLGTLRNFPISELNIKKNKIVDLLWNINKKIELNKKINSELENMAKTIYDYWFLQFEFPNDEGKPYKSSGGEMIWNEELKKEIPDGWEVINIKNCIKHIKTGLNPRNNFKLGNGNIKYITVKNLTTSGNIDFSNCDLIDEKAKQQINKRSEIRKGDILFASIAPLGRCFIIQETPKDWEINESVFSIRPDYDKISSEYLYMFFMSEYFIKKAEASSTGSIFSGIRINTIENMKILIPNKKIVDFFTAKIKNLFYKKFKDNQENQELTSLKDYLLPLLMNGQIGFKD